MKVQVTIDFPCTQEEWSRLEQIRVLAGKGNVLPVSISTEPTSLDPEDTDPYGEELLAQCVVNKVGRLKPTVAELLTHYVADNFGGTVLDTITYVSSQTNTTHKYIRTSLLKLVKSNVLSVIGGRVYIV